MGDSDEEYDRRRGRDKFRPERSDYQERRREEWPDREGNEDYDRRRGRENKRHDKSDYLDKRRDEKTDRSSRDWSGSRERGSSRRGEYRDYEPRSRRYTSPRRHEMSPPMKRMRRSNDWEDRGFGFDGGYPGGGMGPPMWGPPQEMISVPGFGPQREEKTQPPMMSFKQFLSQQDDTIEDQEAVKKYNEYKVEFKSQQIKSFFVDHKEEEWFKAKYHPEEFGKRKQEQLASLKKRLSVFMELFDKKWLEELSVDLDKSEQLIRFLDATVVLLEGGTDQDLLLLDQPEVPETTVQKEESSSQDGKPEEPSSSTSPVPKEKVSDNEDSGSDSDSENSSDEKKSKKNEATGTETNEEVAKEEINKPVPLHKTLSIFLRNLAPNITKQEVEAVSKKYEGFLRVAIADPNPERRFFRRGWVTFRPNVNIKEICWNLNNLRLRDVELGAIVNRDLSRRIRPINGITSHKAILKADIKIAAKIVHHLDSQKELWVEEGKQQIKEQSSNFGSKNPLLHNITDYLIEEASAEEEELLGLSENKDNGTNASEENFETDENLIRVLDRLVLYLRLVHSVDYYNHSEYPCEDEMPNRCGILHARGPVPSNAVTQQEINSYNDQFEQKINHLLQPQTSLSEEEAHSLGRKDPNVEVEKFVESNTQELAKDKWLCPLSGKKFKGPEFVQKHIFNKHGDKVEEVKVEVEYFNNYLLDPKRPQLAEHPSSRPGARPDMMLGAPPFGMRPMPGPGFPAIARPDMYPRPFNRRNIGREKKDPREIISYQDLDMPQESDLF